MFKTDTELAELVPKHQIFLNKLFTAAITEKQSLDSLKKMATVLKPEIHEEIKTVVESLLYTRLREYTLLQYVDMEKRSDFGPMGEQRVSISFCRCILGIPNDREVTQFDADRFRRIIDEETKKYGQAKGDGLVSRMKNPEFDFGFMTVSAIDWKNLNNVLPAVGSELEMLVSYHKGTPTIFLMTCEKKLIGGFPFFLIKKEYVRTPGQVLSIAATSGGDSSVRIRYESCEVIFFNKWQKFFDQSKAELRRALANPNSAIREGIKRRALELYGVKNTAQVKAIKPQFIEDMIDGITWHEIGHKVTDAKEYLDKIANALAIALGRGEYFLKAVTEAFADWAPRTAEKQGAISRFCEIAKTDKAKAKRLVYVYMSDNWFADEHEDFLPYYTDILSSLILAYFEPNGDINFEQLEKDISKIHTFLMKVFHNAVAKLLELLAQNTYQVGIHKLSFEQLKAETCKLYKGSAMDKTKEELLQDTHFWTNVIAYAKKFGSGFTEQLNQYYEREGNALNLAILKILSKGKEQTYNNSLRTFIYERYKTIGVLTEPAKIDTEQAVRMACATMKMPDKIVEKVNEKIKKIISGEPYDISISYEGEKDPFIAVIQEMMLKSNYGDIRAGMTVGELYSSDDTPEKRKQFIKEELENIRDQLESEMYLEIDLLKVNDTHNVKPMVEELLDTVVFFDSKKLREKIKAVQYLPLSSGALFEVMIPLKRGYMDWNTSQAVWRINQDIRPDEFIMQWTIDKEFIEALIETYQ